MPALSAIFFSASRCGFGTVSLMVTCLVAAMNEVLHGGKNMSRK